ncbi:HTH_38 domain-containing protein [Trichonephila clavipes]|nr:HTH_38 domain-containing protein [Trichonephila clavipes]
MTLRRRRSHYQLLTEFERDGMIELKKGGFSFYDIAERLFMNASAVHDIWQRWSRESTTSRKLYSNIAPVTTYREDRCIHHMAGEHSIASTA